MKIKLFNFFLYLLLADQNLQLLRSVNLRNVIQIRGAKICGSGVATLIDSSSTVMTRILNLLFAGGS